MICMLVSYNIFWGKLIYWKQKGNFKQFSGCTGWTFVYLHGIYLKDLHPEIG